MKRITKKKAERFLAGLLALVLVFTNSGLAYAAGEPILDGPVPVQQSQEDVQDDLSGEEYNYLVTLERDRYTGEISPKEIANLGDILIERDRDQLSEEELENGTWSSENTSVLMVNEDGSAMAYDEGLATVIYSYIVDAETDETEVATPFNTVNTASGSNTEGSIPTASSSVPTRKTLSWTVKVEAEEAPKTSFEYNDGRVTVTAEASPAAWFPQDAKINVDYLAPGTSEFNNAVDKAMAARKIDNVDLDYLAYASFYDIYFTSESAKGEDAEGNGRIQPKEGLVTVTMNFAEPVAFKTVADSAASYQVIHITEDDQVETVTEEIVRTDEGKISKITFSSGSFSIFGIEQMSIADDHDLTKKASISVEVQDTKADLNKLDRMQEVELTFTFQMKDSCQPEWADTFPWIYDLNGVIDEYNEDIESIDDGEKTLFEGTTPCGKYTIKNGVVYLYLTEDWLESHKSNFVSGKFYVTLNLHNQNNKDTFRWEFPKGVERENLEGGSASDTNYSNVIEGRYLPVSANVRDHLAGTGENWYYWGTSAIKGDEDHYELWMMFKVNVKGNPDDLDVKCTYSRPKEDGKPDVRVASVQLQGRSTTDRAGTDPEKMNQALDIDLNRYIEEIEESDKYAFKIKLGDFLKSETAKAAQDNTKDLILAGEYVFWYKLIVPEESVFKNYSVSQVTTEWEVDGETHTNVCPEIKGILWTTVTITGKVHSVPSTKEGTARYEWNITFDAKDVTYWAWLPGMTMNQVLDMAAEDEDGDPGEIVIRDKDGNIAATLTNENLTADYNKKVAEGDFSGSVQPWGRYVFYDKDKPEIWQNGPYTMTYYTEVDTNKIPGNFNITQNGRIDFVYKDETESIPTPSSQKYYSWSIYHTENADGFIASKTGAFAKQDEIFTWTIELGAIASGSNASIGLVDIVDELPEGHELVPDSPVGITVYCFESGVNNVGGWTHKVDGSGVSYTVKEMIDKTYLDYDRESGKVTLKISKMGRGTHKEGVYSHTCTTKPYPEDSFPIDGHRFVVTYRTRLTDEGYRLNADSGLGGEVSYTNKAYVVKENGTILDGTVCEGSISAQISHISKSSKQNMTDQDQVTYTIDINPHGVDLAHGNETLKLVDKMEYNTSSRPQVELLTGSLDPEHQYGIKVALIQGETETELSNVTPIYDEENQTITIDGIPNREHVSVTYTVKMKSGAVHIGDAAWLKNTVDLIGTCKDNEPYKYEAVIDECFHVGSITGGTGGLPNTIRLKKLNENRTKQLGDAKFQLYRVEGVDAITKKYSLAEYKLIPVGVEGSTDVENGTLTLGYSEDTKKGDLDTRYLYCLEETSAPDGYWIKEADKKRLFVIYNIDLDNMSKTSINKKDQQNFATSIMNSNPGLGIEIDVRGDLDTWQIINQKKKVTYQPKVTKIVERNPSDKDVSDEKFTFTIEPKDTYDDVIMPINTELEITGVKDTKTEQFGEITFTKPGTYEFKIKETPGTAPGWTYDNSEWILTVTVAEGENTNEDGLYVYTASYKKSGSDSKFEIAEFTNTYKPEAVTYAPKVVKVVNPDGMTVPSGDKYSFILAPVADSAYGDTVVLPGEPAILDYDSSNRMEGYFDDITFNHAGNYKFTITEGVPESGGHYEYDRSKWTLTVDVVDENGILLISSVNYSNGETFNGNNAEFKNTYKPIAATWPVSVKAEVFYVNETPVNKPVGEAEFSYTISQTKGPASVTTDKTITVDTVDIDTSVGSKTGTFGEMTFSKSGEYVFEIKEGNIKSSAEAKYQYTKKNGDVSWTVTVNVDDENGQLGVSEVLYSCISGVPEISTNKEAVFQYTYAPQSVSWQAKLQTSVVGVEPVGEVVFTYDIEADALWPDKVDKPEKATVEVDNTELLNIETRKIEKLSNDIITFLVPGEYTFKITNTKKEGAAEDKYTTDNTVWNVKVTVTDTDGVLTAETNYKRSDDTAEYNNGKAEFTHTYVPDAAVWAAKVRTKVTYDDCKSLVKEIAVPATFGFTIVPESGAWSTDVSIKDSINNVNIMTANMSGGESVEVMFQNVSFKKSGTYKFVIKEDNLSGDVATKYTKDSSEWTVTVQVVDGTDGKLKVVGDAVYSLNDTTTSNTSAEFINIYTPQPVEWQATLETVIKDAKGIPLQPAGEAVFSYTIAPESGLEWPAYATEPTEKIVTVKKEDVDKLAGSNTTEFSGVTFSRPGTYTFKITEDNITGDAADKYEKEDGLEWTVTVEVKDEAGGLQISSVKYSRTGGVTSGDGMKAVFSHIYTPKEVEWNASAQAVVVNEYGEVVQPAGQATFSFTLTPVESWPVGSEGLIAKVKRVGTEKMPNGRSEELKFENVTFTEPGENYQFKIIEREITGTAAARYTKDSDVWTVKVKVVDTSKGELKVEEITYSSEAGKTGDKVAVFTNVYDPEDAHWNARMVTYVNYADGAKEPVQPTSPAAFGFTISHKPADGETEGVVAVEEDNVTISTSEMPGGSSEITAFGDVTFKKPGEYKFEIAEDDNVTGSAADKYTTDSAKWTATVKVEDDATGTLNVTSVVYQKEGKSQSQLFQVPLNLATFKNTYDPADAELSVSAQTDVKYADGEQLKPAGRAVFHYTIAPADGEWPEGMAAPENTSITMAAEDSSDWIKSFEAMTFSRPGEYEFKVTEGAVTGDAADRYTPDSVEWTVKVTVTDEDGELKAGAYCYNGSQYRPLALFRNVYDPEDASWNASLRTVVVDADGERVQPAGEAEFSYTAAPVTENGGWPEGVEAPEAETLTVKTSDLSNGTADTDFGGMTFAKPGTYTFRITEGTAAGAAAARYTSDGAEWTVTVHVTDSEDGALKMETVYTESSAAGAREARAAEAADDQTAEFRHIYKPVEAGWTASVQAEAVDENGEKVQPADDTVFGFTIAPVTDDGSWPEGVEVPESTTVSVTAAAMADGASGLADFEEMTFTKPGEYHFLIMESGITGATAGQYEKDGVVWTATVIVTDDETGTLTAVGGYICSDRERTGDLAVFRNIYRQEESQGGPDDPSENPTEGSGTDTPGENPTEGSGTDTPGENPTEGAGSDTPSGNPTEGSGIDTPSGNPTGGSGTNRPSGGSTGGSGTGGSGSPAGGAESTPLPNLEVITDNPTPLGDGLELTQIDDSEVPLAFLAPVTGDDRPIGAVALFSLMALGMMGAFGILASKKDEDEA